MKKSLLIALGFAALAPSAMAEFQAPSIYPNASFQHISPNGRYVVSEVYGAVTFYDLQKGTVEAFVDSVLFYSAGLGNAISNDGLLLGGLTMDDSAYYLKDGVWTALSTTGAKPNATNLANGITPDGSRICGALGVYEMTLEDEVTMCVPVYWDRKSDGTYGEPVRLPAPEKDYFGHAPQYVSAIAISADGKVIAGQVTDSSGMLQYPIVYIQGEDGKWSYKMVMYDLFNPDHLELPELGEAPEAPQPFDFMTAEQQQQYDEALQKYYQSGYQEDLCPEYVDYMTAEKRSEYEALKAKYEEEFAVWDEQSNAYYNVLGQILESSPNFTFNSVYLTPDGKKYFTTTNSALSYWDPSVYTTWCCDIESGEVTQYGGGDVSLGVCDVPSNDVFMAWDGEYGAYVVKDGQITPIKDYLMSFNPELTDWVTENMTHTVAGYDPETDDIIEVDILAMGMTVASEDLTTMAMWCYPTWNEYIAEGYVFNLGQFTGVSDAVAASKGSVAVDAAGNIVVKGDVAALEVYNLGGSLVLSVAQPQGVVGTELSKGVYVAKATSTDGSVQTVKLVK